MGAEGIIQAQSLSPRVAAKVEPIQPGNYGDKGEQNRHPVPRDHAAFEAADEVQRQR